MRLTSLGIAIITVFLLVGCATTPKPPLSVGPTLPTRPDRLLMDNGNQDINKYPSTKWIKVPKVDEAKGIACWSYRDIKTIDETVTAMNDWADAVEETIRVYNGSLKGGDIHKDRVPWYKKLFR